MFSRLKAESDTVPFNTWAHSDMEDVFFFSFLIAVKYKCLLYLFIYNPYLHTVSSMFHL